MTPPIAVSIIIPVLNEEGSVQPLYLEIVRALDPIGHRFEIVFIDDGSTDGTVGIVDQLIEFDPRVRLIRLCNNSGQTSALAAGIEHARGRILCTMDGDLQNDPADIPMLLGKLDAGYDMVIGWRHARQDDLLRRRIPSIVANRLVASMTKLPIHDTGCGLKVFRAELVAHVPLYGDLHRFLPAVSMIAGSRITEVKVNHRPRTHGYSKYSLARTFEVLLDVFVVRALKTSTARPIRMFASIAIVPMLIGMWQLSFAVWLMLDPDALGPMPLAGSGTLLLGCAVLLICYGAVAEMLVRLGDIKDSQIARMTMRVVRDDRNRDLAGPP